MNNNTSNKKISSGHISDTLQDELNQLPNMNISRTYFLFKHLTNKKKDLNLLNNNDKKLNEEKLKLINYIKDNNMVPFYENICNEFNWHIEETLVHQMKLANNEELSKLDDQYKDAIDNLGEIEVLEALLAKATLYSRIGDKENAIKAFAKSGEKPQSSNIKIQIVLHLIRIGLFFNDLNLVKEKIHQARKLIDEGGDWDRRNRLKVYEGCYFLMSREITKAAKLFQESVATFTSTEILDYPQMIFYCVLCNVLSMKRTDLREKIIESPEIVAVVRDVPNLQNFLNGIYQCDYKLFFTSIVEMHSSIEEDQFLSRHTRFIYRELRLLAYSQFLQAYQSVKLESMSQSFGVGIPYLDAELSRFISAGRLCAKIDKVNGIVETNRPDDKNAQYQEMIKKGDSLLNRIQRLSRVINI